MRQLRPILLFLLLIFVAACQDGQADQSGLRILRSRQLAQLPAASGITNCSGKLIVNPDNAPYLYVLDSAGNLTDSIALIHENTEIHEVPKPQKSDYEAASTTLYGGRPYLLLLGSGSLSPHRDSALILSLDSGTQYKMNLRPFYDALIHSGVGAKALNIEAAASRGQDLLLFNRGTNQLITTSSDSLLNALRFKKPLPQFRLRAVNLPAVNGYHPGISGATMLNDSTVLFCASIEATTDWAKDGPIIGSGIGVLRLNTGAAPELMYWQLLRSKDGALMREKLEGIEVMRRNRESAIVRCVTDNDDGSSGVVDVELTLSRSTIVR